MDAMETLRKLYGWPHEALHVVALWMVGRRALAITRMHVDLPDDLTTGQFVLVAGLPALVFGGGALLGTLGLLNATTLTQAALALGVIVVFGLGFAGTVGDVQMILLRLTEDRTED